MNEFEQTDSVTTPEQRLGLSLNDLVGANFMPGLRGRIKGFKYNEKGERVAEIKNPGGQDFTARLDQLKKLE
jgi:hypothetical protein